MDKRKKYKRTNNDLQNITHKTKDRVTRTPLKTRGELRYSEVKSKICKLCIEQVTLFRLNNTFTHQWAFGAVLIMQIQSRPDMIFNNVSRFRIHFMCILVNMFSFQRNSFNIHWRVLNNKMPAYFDTLLEIFAGYNFIKHCIFQGWTTFT